MLNILRKRAQSVVIQALVLLIAVVFIFWGVGSNLDNNRNAAAVVNDVEIPFQEFQQSYDRAVDTYRQQLGGQVPEGFFEGIGLKKQVINQLIQSELLRQSADKIGLAVSREETQRRIQDMPVFQENGQFVMSRYKDVLGQNRLTPTSFEAGLQSDLITGRVVELIGSFADVPPAAVQAWIDFAKTELKLVYLSFKGSDYLDEVNVEADKLASWYEKKQQDYVTDPQIALQYLYFPFAADMGKVTLEDEQVEQFYNDNIDRYSVKEKRRARHILFKVSDTDSAEVKEEKRLKAEHVLQLLRDGGDFATLAKEYSEGPSRESGGELGFFERGSMVPAFEEAVFSMEPGDLSDLVETSFGYHLILVEDVQPAITKKMEDVRAEIEGLLKKQRVRGLTFQNVSNAYEDIIRAGSLEKYMEQGGKAVQTTDLFARKLPPDSLAKAGALLDVAFGLSKGELSSLVEVEDGYAIGYVKDIKKPEVPPLATVKDKVVSDYKHEQSITLAHAAADKALAIALEAGKLMPEGKGLESGYLKRGGGDGDIPPQLVEAAFALKGGEKLSSEVVAVGDMFYVFEVLEHRQDPTAMEADQKKQLAEQLLVNQQNRLVASWVERLRADAKIWVNDQLIP
ncbi:SurA N-terminal domain-containing protein [Desulfogranum marinum]|uniref:SurA N-terminal domain-containing protein n=1 Tax=Desulfogranum marinum TaxID=453220 RepID=UPI0019635947|nr:SurA N-terminal domain-containing protein [Desulfogranum marinum]MBM9511395.1 SurA N-terminal domain-containing protein [Desulfogranum marinum]